MEYRDTRRTSVSKFKRLALAAIPSLGSHGWRSTSPQIFLDTCRTYASRLKANDCIPESTALRLSSSATSMAEAFFLTTPLVFIHLGSTPLYPFCPPYKL